MAGGGVQKIYMMFLREPSQRDRSGSDLFHLRDGFEIKMNFDRRVFLDNWECFFVKLRNIEHDTPLDIITNRFKVQSRTSSMKFFL